MAPAAAPLHDRAAAGYKRHHPETTALCELVRDNLETLYCAIVDGALDADGTIAIDMDLLSLLCRLAMSWSA